MRFALAICAMLLALGPTQTGAHAFVDHADPRVGSTVKASPGELRIWFTQEIEGAFSTVNVSDAKGERVSKGESRVDSADHTMLRVPLGDLAPGVYRVAWRVVSLDTHVTEGDFVFTVGR